MMLLGCSTRSLSCMDGGLGGLEGPSGRSLHGDAQPCQAPRTTAEPHRPPDLTASLPGPCSVSPAPSCPLFSLQNGSRAASPPTHFLCPATSKGRAPGPPAHRTSLSNEDRMVWGEKSPVRGRMNAPEGQAPWPCSVVLTLLDECSLSSSC